MKTIGNTNNLCHPAPKRLKLPVERLLLCIIPTVAKTTAMLAAILIMVLEAVATTQRLHITANMNTINKAVATENPDSQNTSKMIIYNLVAGKKITTKEADNALKNLNNETIDWEPASKKFIKKPLDREKQKEKNREKWLASHKQLLS
jgi:hypothetical protein